MSAHAFATLSTVRETFVDTPQSDRTPLFRLLSSLLSMVVAAAVIIALGAKIIDLVDRGLFDAGRFFSYFAPAFALLSILILSITALLGTKGRRDSARVAGVRAALTLGGITILCTHTSLLSAAPTNTEPFVGTQTWPDAIIEIVLPLYLIAEWILNPLRARVSRWAPFVGLALIHAWVIFSHLRGQLTGWYVNPALDPQTAENPMAVIAYLVVISVSLLVAAFLLLVVNRIHYRIFPRNFFES